MSESESDASGGGEAAGEAVRARFELGSESDIVCEVEKVEVISRGLKLWCAWRVVEGARREVPLRRTLFPWRPH